VTLRSWLLLLVNVIHRHAAIHVLTKQEKLEERKSFLTPRSLVPPVLFLSPKTFPHAYIPELDRRSSARGTSNRSAARRRCRPETSSPFTTTALRH
jgi:hypothetical protein